MKAVANNKIFIPVQYQHVCLDNPVLLVLLVKTGRF